MMIQKDNLEMLDDDVSPRDGQMMYIPRIGSGKKRGNILSLAIPTNRLYVDSLKN